MDTQQLQDTPALAGRYATPEQAGELAGLTPQCIRRYCRRFGLGEFVAGRWLIDRDKLTAFLRERAGGDHAQG